MSVCVPQHPLHANLLHVQGLPALQTAQDIRDLNHLDVRTYMRGYGLPSDAEDRRQAIAIAIGCPVDI